MLQVHYFNYLVYIKASRKYKFRWNVYLIFLIKTLSSREEDRDQIVMPPIRGKIRFEDVRFRFGDKGPYQVNVSLQINDGSFVSIVGQSGSGKSTLTKLLPDCMHLIKVEFLSMTMILEKLTCQLALVQIGIVHRFSSFEGTIAENITLNDLKPVMTQSSKLQNCVLRFYTLGRLCN